jgi:acyl-CoA synthetase (AMP-forming)/AMP-acid ligase II
VVPAGPEVSHPEIAKFCAERLPRYMLPERIELCDQLPKTSTGKIDKTTLEKESKLYAERTAS